MSLLINKVVFNRDDIKAFLTEHFDDMYDKGSPSCRIKDEFMYIRLKNGNSFNIWLYNCNDNKSIHAELRRKYTSIKPDWEENFSLTAALDEIIIRIRNKLNSLNNF